MSEKKAMYDVAYNRQFIRVKHVQFNMKNPMHVALMNWLDSKKSKNAFLLEILSDAYEREMNGDV